MSSRTKLINDYGTVVEIVDKPIDVDEPNNRYHQSREQELRDAGYRDLEKDDVAPPQHYEVAPAAHLAGTEPEPESDRG